MSLGDAHYLYAVELGALEEQLGQSIDRVVQLRSKAVKRNDLQAADQIARIHWAIKVAQHRIVRLK
jgi:hypothetical protein